MTFDGHINMWDKKSRFTALVQATSSKLYRYAWWLCQDKQIAEDLVQETFARAWKSLEDLREEKAALAWLMTTLRHENARRFEQVQAEFSAMEVDALADHYQHYDTSTEAFVLRQALVKMPKKYCEPLILQVLEGLSCDEIADQLEISTSAVMTRLFRARQKLREMINGNKVEKVSEL